jgi:hypothetical protein
MNPTSTLRTLQFSLPIIIETLPHYNHGSAFCFVHVYYMAPQLLGAFTLQCVNLFLLPPYTLGTLD